jgi:hypothetical protein
MDLVLDFKRRWFCSEASGPDTAAPCSLHPKAFLLVACVYEKQMTGILYLPI